MMADSQEPLTVPRDWEATVDANDAPGLPAASGAAAARMGVETMRSSSAAWLELVFLLGLAGVFLSNAAVAVVEPAGFREMVLASPMGGLIGDGAWIAPLIAVNDLLIGTAIIAAHRVASLRAPVLAWAGVWLLMVTVMKITTMG